MSLPRQIPKPSALVPLGLTLMLCLTAVAGDTETPAYQSPHYRVETFTSPWKKLPGFFAIQTPVLTFAGPTETRIISRQEDQSLPLRSLNADLPFQTQPQGQNLIFHCRYPMADSAGTIHGDTEMTATLAPNQITVHCQGSLNHDLLFPMHQTTAFQNYCVFKDQSLRGWTFFGRKTNGHTVMANLKANQTFNRLTWLFQGTFRQVRLEKDGNVLAFVADSNTTMRLAAYQETLELYFGRAVTPGTKLSRNTPVHWNYTIHLQTEKP